VAVQHLRGYCILLAEPEIDQLATLSDAAQAEFLTVMVRVGGAIRDVTGAVRVNYGIYGNLDPFLHAHVWPRYADEPAALRALPPLAFPADVRESEADRFSTAVHQPLMHAIRHALRQRELVTRDGI
jgi:diadenosine tetraphosphate (Ap4A) HIT family hydrolase